MMANIRSTSKRGTNVIEPNTQISSRREIFEESSIDEEAIKEDAQKMDMLMRSLMGFAENQDETQDQGRNQDVEDQDDKKKDDDEEEEFEFRLFASQPVATVTIADIKDNTDSLSKAIAEQQVYEFDETDPEFLSRVEQVAVDYETILKQSKVPYPTAIMPHRIIHLPSYDEQAKKDLKEKKKKRKSKKCRDFEKAVKEGRIKLEPNMRNPETPGGWPGWPGNLTRVAIINYQSPKKQGGRGSGFKGKVFNKGGYNSNNRGGRGAHRMSRGRGRGRGRPY
ncbi:uncharacterized protein BX663DRAFT_503680 [Cokeromyces recurvatus]|uniref:uncharacterized protein n=1 Tax=Cokeromyces recurvatus TaxID=90255 RepID=UPI00221EEE1B|nr:uncharacterized protein BX663DRAFT_503680 [Cokeromyces recurvatus]KAI7904818.1 hypothetical protein BX663DRAFT_503680 [Cokeromyces recurvatus]